MDRQKRFRQVQKYPPPRFRLANEPIQDEHRQETIFIHPNADDAPVGKIHGEFIKNTNQFRDLDRVRHFRRLLSNRDEEHPFYMNNLLYKSIEHVFQETKYCMLNPAEKGSFSMDGPYGNLPLNDLMNMTSRENLNLDDELFEEWMNIQGRVQYEACREQFSQHPFKMAVLKATNDATIMMVGKNPNQKKIHFWWLEFVRDEKLPEWD